jgi:hypothetical protein
MASAVTLVYLYDQELWLLRLPICIRDFDGLAVIYGLRG